MTANREKRLLCFFAAISERDGVFSWSQASEFGLTQYEIANGLKTGVWRRFHGVYQLAGAPDTERARLRAALTCTGPGSCATGPSALQLWNFDAQPGAWSNSRVSYVILPPGRKLRVADVEIVRDNDVELRTVAGIDTVTRERAVVDSLRLLPIEDGRTVLYRALQLRWVDANLLDHWCDALRNRRGVDLLRAHLKDAQQGTHAESERLLVRLLRLHRIQGWRANMPVHDEQGLIGYGDIVFPAIRLVIEVDGRAWHSDHERFQRDRTRQNRLINSGCRVLRFTWADLTESPLSVIAQIKRAVDVSFT
ncbi:MAG: DUF559 domain-containing protein [Candidatus Nanopelagicales bacterium]